MSSKRYTLNVWQSGDASLTISDTPGRHRPTHEFSLVNNGAGFDVFDYSPESFEPNGMPVATVPDLPAALSWAMTSLTITEKEN